MTAQALVGTLVRIYTPTRITVGRVHAVTPVGIVLDAYPLLPRGDHGAPYLPDPTGTPRRTQVVWGAATHLEGINRLSVPVVARTLPLPQIAAAARAGDTAAPRPVDR